MQKKIIATKNVYDILHCMKVNTLLKPFGYKVIYASRRGY